ncbi:hypothetical protein TNCV_2692881 [Trichonephila clavipes]|uniref:Uncharacterized protein n=1 Tax=Trichonephila clavipes TaxID=2585209 RepID=A0A8X7BC19_TRICX|nr:hypothetical protein TNCV_2692881 [Trichonephila clavipes]
MFSTKCRQKVRMERLRRNVSIKRRGKASKKKIWVGGRHKTQSSPYGCGCVKLLIAMVAANNSSEGSMFWKAKEQEYEARLNYYATSMHYPIDIIVQCVSLFPDALLWLSYTHSDLYDVYP